MATHDAEASQASLAAASVVYAVVESLLSLQCLLVSFGQGSWFGVSALVVAAGVTHQPLLTTMPAPARDAQQALPA
jgi:hypothetical protein